MAGPKETVTHLNVLPNSAESLAVAQNVAWLTQCCAMSMTTTTTSRTSAAGTAAALVAAAANVKAMAIVRIGQNSNFDRFSPPLQQPEVLLTGPTAAIVCMCVCVCVIQVHLQF